MKRNFYSYCYLLVVLSFVYCLPAFSQSTTAKTANEIIPPFASSFGYGSNTRGQSNGWTDQLSAGIIRDAGGTTLRATLPDYFIENYSTDVRLDAFKLYTSTLGLKDLTCFIGNPSSDHQDKTVYPGCTSSSLLFANMYAPIWNWDGTINQDNYYANYVYKLVQMYGPYIRLWEVVNEPDYSYADPSQWFTRAPLPSELINIQAPFYNYIRMLRITWEVVKKYYPNSLVTIGGVGNDSFLDAALRYTDNPADGSVTWDYPNKGGAYFDVVSYHMYPSYSLRYWDNSIQNFRFTQNSDHAAQTVIDFKYRLNNVLKKYGYDGSVYPQKYYIVTETNVSRRTCDWRYGTDEIQRNYGMKLLVLAQKNDIKQIHIYGVGESIDAPPPGTTVYGFQEYQLMGLYENLERDAPGSQKLTQLGVGYKTTSTILKGYTYDGAATAALNLPATVLGGAFQKDGNYIYVLWASNYSVSQGENGTAAYSFPSSLGISTFDRLEWDYSTTQYSVKQSSTDITLTNSPSFFRSGSTGTVSAPVVTNNTTSGPIVYRINAGGPQVNTTSGVFIADAFYSPTPGHTYSTSASIAGTVNGPKYQTERYGTNGTFSYAFPVPAGSYSVKLYFAEIYWTAAGKRIFDVNIEGNKVLDDYDIFRKVGANTATSETFTVNVTDGMLNIDFSSLPQDGGVDQPKVSAIQILSASTTSTARTISDDEEVSVSKPEALTLNLIDQISAYPNPFVSTATLQFNVAKSGPAQVDLYDMQNRLVKRLYSAYTEAGVTKRITLPSTGLAQGAYAARLTTGTKMVTKNIVLLGK